MFSRKHRRANGLMFGPDGRLYACQNGRSRIVAYDAAGKESVITEGAGSNDLAINSKGRDLLHGTRAHRVWFVNAKGEKRVVHEGITLPTESGFRLIIPCCLSPTCNAMGLVVPDTARRIASVWTRFPPAGDGG